MLCGIVVMEGGAMEWIFIIFVWVMVAYLVAE